MFSASLAGVGILESAWLNFLTRLIHLLEGKKGTALLLLWHSSDPDDAIRA